jgi:hypothetical protein
MGKSTLVTRRGVRQSLSRPGARHSARVSWLSGSHAKARYPSGGHDVSGQRPFGRESLQVSVREGPVLPVFGGSLFPSTPGHFRGCRMVIGHSLSRGRHYPPPPLTGVTTVRRGIVDIVDH